MTDLKDIARKMNAIYGSTERLPELPTLQEEWFRLDREERLQELLKKDNDFKRIFYLTGKELRGGMMDHDDWYELITRMDRVVRRMKKW